MPWTEVTVLEQRLEFVKLADRPDTNMSKLCRRYGISRKTGYKWLDRWRSHGKEGLADRSRRPHTSPNKTPDWVEQHVLSTYARYSRWGGRKLRQRMLLMVEEGQLPLQARHVPAGGTITRILKRHGVWAPIGRGPTEQAATERFEQDRPNQQWQADFKGEFPVADGQLCYPLTLIDDYSRFNLTLKACGGQDRPTVQSHLQEAFEQYGVPERIVWDNGPPWGAGIGWADWGPYYTGLAVWMIRLGIRIRYSRPGHPQTHGKNERFNGTLKDELITPHKFSDLDGAQHHFDWWRDRYNIERPHDSLDGRPPVEYYAPSPRSLPKQLPPVEYPDTERTRKVHTKGTISWKGQKIKVGKAFSGYHVAIRTKPTTDEQHIYFCHQPIRKLPADNHQNNS